MNNFKNTVIVLLSLIVLVQSAFLIYFVFSGRSSVFLQSHQETRGASVSKKEPVSSESPKPLFTEEKSVKEEPVKSIGKIALVLDDWGYNLKNKNFITGNDYHVCVSVLPFKAHSSVIAKLAHDKNKDVVIHMPMEPESKASYGLEENTLLVGMDRQEIDRILEKAFHDVPYARGLSNHMGSKATQNRRLMNIIMEFLKDNNLFFLDSVVTSKSVCRNCAEKFKVRIIRRDVFIDNESDPVYIRKQIMELASKARMSGLAVGIGHDRPATISVLEEVIPELLKEGFEFVNLSEIERPLESR